MLRAVRSSSLGREFSHPTQLNQKLQLFVTELKASDRCERIKPQARTSSGRRRPRPHRLTSWLLQSCRPEAVRVTAGNGFVVKHPATATRPVVQTPCLQRSTEKQKRNGPPSWVIPRSVTIAHSWMESCRVMPMGLQSYVLRRCLERVWRVQIPSEEVLGALQIHSTCLY